ncbi:DNA polymerase III subunit alpha [Puia sp.]|jgi:DNA polymerase-3 subunit alpha|uniref:DNA polymerase III subunit alpha n=1 Tax=Puia sp. TaxID=2045100 RepID=UPI002F406445
MYLCKSYFSFNYGTFATEELVKSGADTGATTLTLTNINSTCDAWDFVQFCTQQGIKPILGAEIRNGNTLLYILIAANNKGFRRINEFLSEYLREKKPFPAGNVLEPVFYSPEDGFIIHPIGGKTPESLNSNERIGVLPGEVNRLLKLPLASSPDKWVIRQPVTFQNKVYYNLHRLLRAIDGNTLLSKLKPEDLASPQEYFLPQVEMLTAFRQHSAIITNTYRLIDACSITMDFGVDKNKQLFTASREDDRVLLEKLARDGFRFRYGANKKVKERFNKELRIIDQMGFTAYFLITWDMIRYAQSRGFYHVGRGSGANSLVAYCLQITDVDPIELDLYFERFLNPHRTSPPDFDIDFSYLDRDEIIDYMMKRYGRNHTTLLGMYPTFQYNAIIRELGKVFGLPKAEIDELASRGYSGDRIQRAIIQYGKLLQNFPSGLSIHPGGILISEKPLANYCTIHLPPKGFPTAMIDMFVAENIGLYKLDVLSQRGLGHIKECIQLVRANHRIDINIHEIDKFKKDPAIKEQLRIGNTIGCFYIESPAMRQLIKKLKCDNYETLVAASSIIRPGVGRSGMMYQYIYRYNNPGKFEYLHPKLKEILGSTYGVMIYQEQVIQVAHEWAGLEMADADLLRRATSSKYRGKGHLPMLKEKFFANCSEAGYPAEATQEVWRQIESFADYSFCKAHSASYAVESYQSLFLKTHFPMEFAVAVINNFGGFYSRELYFYELMRTGARVHRPCVNNSDYYTNLRGKEAYVGFVHIKGLEQTFADRITESRECTGLYSDLADLIERTAATSEQLDILIRTGALRFTGKSKKELLWEGDFVQKRTKLSHPVSHPLFKEAPVSFTLPDLPVYPMEDYYDDIELLGFPVGDPFFLADDDPSRYGTARDLAGRLGRPVTVLGYHITHKPVQTVKGDMMSFGTFLDVNKEWIDTVHFPPIHAAHPPQAGFFRITGKVIEEFGVYSIEVTRIEKVGIKTRTPQTI